MANNRHAHVLPSIEERAFNCPNCGAFAQQFWLKTFTRNLKDDATPPRMSEEWIARIHEFDFEDEAERRQVLEWADKMMTGRPFMYAKNAEKYTDYRLENVSVSRCYKCDEIAIWIDRQMLYPAPGVAPPANPDLPQDIRDDYNEASSILDLSPRGAAALVRLCIQKLCRHLGEKGANINDDIASLVKKGLDVRIQQSLDIVRVTGNNMVHPGQMVIDDDRATAERLFELVNLIADRMISEPKRIEEVYRRLPDGALEQIAKRDGKEPS